MSISLLLAAMSAHAENYTTVSIPSALLNNDIRTWTNGSAYNGYMTGTQTFAGIPFAMQTNGSGYNVIWATSTNVFALGSSTYTNTATINTNVYGATTVYTLINLAWGTNGRTVGSVTFNASDGTSYSVNLVVNQNVRDHNSNGGGITATYVTTNVMGTNGGAHLDMQAFALPASFANKTLSSIVFTTTGSQSTGIPFLAGVTIGDGTGQNVGYFPLEETTWNGTAGDTKDNAGYAGGPYNGQSSGSPLPTPATINPAISGTVGTCGYANLAGTSNGGAIFNNNLPLNTYGGAKASVSFWMYWDGANSTMPVGFKTYDLWFSNGSFGFNTFNSDIYGISSTGLSNSWHHVVAVFTAGDVSQNKLYIDGVLQSLSQRTGTINNYNASITTTPIIGGVGNSTGFRFTGLLDEFKFYNGEVSQSQVTADYTATHSCPSSTVAANFNCVVTGGSAGSGHLLTQVAGNNFNVDVVALKSDGTSVETSYVLFGSKNVTLEFVDGSGSTACASRSALSPAVSQTVTFAPSNYGRKAVSNINISKAYRDLRCRVSDANQSPNVVGCSSDDFAVRPSNFTVTSTNANADNTGTSTSATPTVKAGTNFSLTAATGVVGYDGTPLIDTSKLAAHTGAIQTGTLSGSFSAANAATGSATGSAFSYSEVGYARLAANGVYDSTFTAVDSANGDCTTGFSASGGINACSFGNTSNTNFFGRFIPDRFAITTGTNTEGCDSGDFTYYGQDGLSTAFTLTARNSANAITQNYTGSFAKLGLTNWANFNFSAQGSPYSPQLSASVTSPTGTWANGSASVSAKHQISRLLAMLPESPKCADEKGAGASGICSFSGTRTVIYGANGKYTSGVFTNSVSCNNSYFADPIFGVVKACYLGTPASPSTITVFASPTDSDGVTMTSSAVSASSNFRFGRLAVSNAYGSELLPLTVPIEAQYWNGTAYQRNQLDSCSSLPSTSIAMSFNSSSNLVACETQLSGAGTLSAGKTTATLSKPGAGNAGRVDLSVNLNAASGNTCASATQTSATNANLPWFGSTNPSARETFGIFKSPVIYLRENF